jgi:hypothetical protein
MENQEATVEGVPVSLLTAKFPEFRALVEKYVAIANEENDLRVKLNAKVGARQEFEVMLKKYVDDYKAADGAVVTEAVG